MTGWQKHISSRLLRAILYLLQFSGMRSGCLIIALLCAFGAGYFLWRTHMPKLIIILFQEVTVSPGQPLLCFTFSASSMHLLSRSFDPARYFWRPKKTRLTGMSHNPRGNDTVSRDIMRYKVSRAEPIAVAEKHWRVVGALQQSCYLNMAFGG